MNNYIDLDEEELEIVLEYRDEVYDKESVEKIMNSYVSQYDNINSFAIEHLNISEHLESYIDWEKVTNELKNDYFMTKSGYLFRLY